MLGEMLDQMKQALTSSKGKEANSFEISQYF